MRHEKRVLRLGIAGCGAIGSRIATAAVSGDLGPRYRLSGVFDIDSVRSAALAAGLKGRPRVCASLGRLVAGCDVLVECVNSDAAAMIVTRGLSAGKTVLAMSVGRLWGREEVFALARRKGTALVIPSGALAGLDAVKAARGGGLRRVTLTTRKPPEGFQGNEFLKRRGIDPRGMLVETVLFDGPVRQAVERFPLNINVAAALALAAGKVPVRVRIVAVPGLKRNTHEVTAEGRSGTVRSMTENIPCPDNPRTSYLAVLSGMEALKQIADPVRVGA